MTKVNRWMPLTFVTKSSILDLWFSPVSNKVWGSNNIRGRGRGRGGVVLSWGVS